MMALSFSHRFMRQAGIALLVCAPLLATRAQTAPAAASPAATAPEQCILAGRLDGEQRWAPQSRGVELLDASGKTITSSSKQALAFVKAVRLSQPAILSNCNGNQALPEGGALSGKKTAAPALAASKTPINVESVSYPPLRVGGELVELKVDTRSAQLVQLTR